MNDLTTPRPYRDRTVGLILFGILEIGIALLFLLYSALVLVAWTASSSMATSPFAAMSGRSIAFAAGLYLLLAGLFGTLGVGTIRGRRWARTLMLVLSWTWLLCGLFASIGMFFFLPKILAGMPNGASEESAKMFVGGCMVVIAGVLYILLPGLFVLFYRGPNVRATFEAKDPNIPWTDRTPMPLLAISLLLGYCAVAFLLGGVFLGAFPILGMLLTGIPAILACLILGALCAYLARATYLRQPAAWWGLLGFAIFGLVSTVLAFAGHPDLRETYRAMGIATPEMEQMGIYDIWRQPAFIGLMSAVALAWIGFVVWLRKYFRPEPPATVQDLP